MVANLPYWDDEVTNLYYYEGEVCQFDPPRQLLGFENDKWNEWKSSVEGQIFLVAESFEGLDLSGANLSNIVFVDCAFHNTKCVDVDFRNSTFCVETLLKKVNLKGANLDFAQFWNLEIADVKFNKSSMRNTNFFQCEFTADCTFKGVDVSTANGISHPDVVSPTIIDGEAYAAYRNPKNGKVRIWTSSGPIDSLSDLDAPFRDQLHYWFAMVKVKFKCESYDLVIST